jgi:CheY-like chemotaxis protein
MNSQILSVGKIAKMSQVGRATVQRWIHDGKLKSFTLPSGHFRVHAENYILFLKEYNMPLPRELKSHFRQLLVLEPDPLTKQRLGKFLKDFPDWKAETVFIETGVEACLQIGLLQPEIVFLSLSAEDVNVLEILQVLRKLPDMKNIRVVALCSHASVHQGEPPGVDACLFKPFSEKELFQICRRLIPS